MGWTKKQITQLRDQMRKQGRSDDEIADEIRHRCGNSPLAAYRQLHGWSQEEVAERYRRESPGLVLDQAALSRLELWPGQGSRAPQAAQISTLAALYNTAPLRLLSPEGLDKLDKHERSVMLRIGAAENRSAALTQQTAPVQKNPTGRVLFDFATPERQVEMAAQRALRFGSMAEGSNIGPETIQQLYSEVERISSVYPRTPIHYVLGDLVEAQDVAFRLLEGRQRPNQAKDLYLLSGLLSLMLAKASHDLGDPHAAMKQARTAYICADNAEHDGLRIRIRAQQSLMAYWAGWKSEAARYADLGRDLATRHTGSAAVWLMSQSSRSWASLGDGERANDDLTRATALQEDLENDDLDGLGGLMRFARCRQLYYGAETRIWIPSQEEQAEQAALIAIEAYEEAENSDSDAWAYGDDAGARADLAFVRAMRGEVEGAAAALAPVLELPVGQRVAGIIASTMRVHGALRDQRYAGSRAANQLRQEIEGYGQAPAAALTSGR